jgi:hypothetical protein
MKPAFLVARVKSAQLLLVLPRKAIPVFGDPASRALDNEQNESRTLPAACFWIDHWLGRCYFSRHLVGILAISRISSQKAR